MDVKRLNELMEQGWNIFIECKGLGREYEMTFEATAHRVVTVEMTNEDKVKAFYPIHAVGKDFTELIDVLTIKLTRGE